MLFLGILGEMSAFYMGKDVVVEWKIPDLDSLSKEVDAYYESPSCFSYEGELWCLNIIPNGGTSTDYVENTSLFLSRIYDSGLLIPMAYSLALKTANGQKDSEIHKAEVFEGNRCHSFSKFLSRCEFEKRKSEFLVSGFLTVVCTVKRFDPTEFEYLRKTYEDAELMLEKVVKENVDHKKELEAYKTANEILLKEKLALEAHLKATRANSEGATCISIDEIKVKKPDKSETPESNESKVPGSCENGTIIKANESGAPEYYGVVTDINCLLKEGKGVDVTFVLETSDGDTKIFAHQLILAVRSSFFADEFYSKKKNEKHKIIPLKGIDPKAFEKMIRYCYDCKLGLRTTEEACTLFKVAFEFRMVSLVNFCGTYLKSTKIETGNVFRVLEVAEKMEDNSLRDMCLKILQEKTGEIMASYELRDVTPSMVHIILKLPKLSLNSEYELITWALEWAKLKSEDKNMNYKSTRNYLGNLLRDMNFLSLTGEEFANFCKDHPDFFTSEEIASLSLNIMIPGAMNLPEWCNKNLKLRVHTGSKN